MRFGAFSDFHAANRKNKNTKMCLPFERQAENKRLGSTAVDFWEHSLGVLYGLAKRCTPATDPKGSDRRPGERVGSQAKPVRTKPCRQRSTLQLVIASNGRLDMKVAMVKLE